mgnify:CR=1 FL=1
MVSDVSYCQNILTNYGITDVKVTEDMVGAKSNYTKNGGFNNMNQFSEQIGINISRALEVYRRYVKEWELVQ